MTLFRFGRFEFHIKFRDTTLDNAEDMPSWSVLLGSLVIAFTLREVFQDLFHPTASGSLSDFVASGIFDAFRHFPRFLTDAAPLAVVLVILIWALSVCVGFALIYWGLPPADFNIAPHIINRRRE